MYIVKNARKGLKDIYEQGDHAVSVEDGFLKLTFEESFDAVAVIFG